ncbi:MAG: hypothetical protein ABJN40_05925 [Sneathiella sp.]
MTETPSINDAFSFGRIPAPSKWHVVGRVLIAFDDPGEHPYDDVAMKRALHAEIRDIRSCDYTPDAERDLWEPNASGDCEDKCLSLLLWSVGTGLFNSLRLAICELPTGQQHAVLLLYTAEGTKVIDPTFSTLAVAWDLYPVNKWIMRHRCGFLWENFKEREQGTQ